MQKSLPLTFLEELFVWFAVLSDPHAEGLPSMCPLPCTDVFRDQNSPSLKSAFLSWLLLLGWFSRACSSSEPCSEILKAKHRSVEECIRKPRKPQPLPPAFLLPGPPQLSPASFPGSHTDYTARLSEASWQCHQTEPSVSPCECPTGIYGRLKKYLGWVRGGKVTRNKVSSCKPHFKLNLPGQ